MQDRALILLSGSRDKRDDGSQWPNGAQTIIDRSYLPQEGANLAQLRKWIFQRLKGEEPRLYNSDHKGGLCDERW